MPTAVVFLRDTDHLWGGEANAATTFKNIPKISDFVSDHSDYSESLPCIPDF